MGKRNFIKVFGSVVPTRFRKTTKIQFIAAEIITELTRLVYCTNKQQSEKLLGELIFAKQNFRKIEKIKKDPSSSYKMGFDRRPNS